MDPVDLEDISQAVIGHLEEATRPLSVAALADLACASLAETQRVVRDLHAAGRIAHYVFPCAGYMLPERAKGPPAETPPAAVVASDEPPIEPPPVPARPPIDTVGMFAIRSDGALLLWGDDEDDIRIIPPDQARELAGAMRAALEA